ncbi:MAG: DUF167 domain-containing protein [Candidatus Njordarchaeota archaeon]
MRIKIVVKPNSKKPNVIRENDRYVVWVDAPPIKNKANKRLIEILAKYFGKKKSDIHIIYGEKSREKIIEIKE